MPSPRTASERSRSSQNWPARFSAPAFLLLAATAYRSLWSLTASEDFGVESLLFIPGQRLAAPAICVGLWIGWTRRDHLRRLPRVGSPILAWPWALSGAGCFAWALHVGSADLLLLSLSFHILALGAALRGLAGFRTLLAPAIVLSLGIQVPAPLASEWIWYLQLWTARDTAWLVDLLGSEISQAGVLLWSDSVRFQVIEGCSGFRGTRILLFVAFIVRELFGAGAPRTRLNGLILAAPVLGYLVNVIRVGLIVMADHTETTASGDHIAQGVGVLIVGSTALYAAGWCLGSGHPRATEAADMREGNPRLLPQSRRVFHVIVLMAAAQLLLSMSIEALPAAEYPRDKIVEFPVSAAHWTSESVALQEHDSFFFGSLPWEQVVYRRYREDSTTDQFVEVFITPDLPTAIETGKHFSSRIRTPGVDYRVIETQALQIATLGVEAEQTLLSRGESTQAAFLAYNWRVRDRGLWRESLAALVEPGVPHETGKRPRVVVRLMAPVVHRGRPTLDRSRNTLERFIEAFRPDLESL